MFRGRYCIRGFMAALVVVMSGPLAARAETPIAQVTLYEVDEALKFKAHGHDTDAVQARLAQASLLGSARDVCALPVTNGVTSYSTVVLAGIAPLSSVAALVGAGRVFQ